MSKKPIDDGGAAMPGHRITSVVTADERVWTVRVLYAGHPQQELVGSDIVQINQHVPQGEDGRWYYDMAFHTGDVTRRFDVVEVKFEKMRTKQEHDDGED